MGRRVHSPVWAPIPTLATMATQTQVRSKGSVDQSLGRPARSRRRMLTPRDCFTNTCRDLSQITSIIRHRRMREEEAHTHTTRSRFFQNSVEGRRRGRISPNLKSPAAKKALPARTLTINALRTRRLPLWADCRFFGLDDRWAQCCPLLGSGHVGAARSRARRQAEDSKQLERGDDGGG